MCSSGDGCQACSRRQSSIHRCSMAKNAQCSKTVKVRQTSCEKRSGSTPKALEASGGDAGGWCAWDRGGQGNLGSVVGRSRGWPARIHRSGAARADEPAATQRGRPPRRRGSSRLPRERLPALGDEQPRERFGAHRDVTFDGAQFVAADGMLHVQPALEPVDP